MLAESLPYLCNWIQFCDFLENEQPWATIGKVTIVEEPAFFETEFPENNKANDNASDEPADDDLEVSTIELSGLGVDIDISLPEVGGEDLLMEPLELEESGNTTTLALTMETQPELSNELEITEELLNSEAIEETPQADVEKNDKSNRFEEEIDPEPAEMGAEKATNELEIDIEPKPMDETFQINIIEVVGEPLIREEINSEFDNLEPETMPIEPEIELEGLSSDNSLELEVIEEEIIHRFIICLLNQRKECKRLH
jgi:hypothetical protein